MLTLRRDDQSLVVAPVHGGALVGWNRGAARLLRPVRPEAVVAGSAHAMGCFPLVPYCNRIAGGRFTWDGRPHAIALNFGDHPNAIHGIGWQRAWTVEAVSASSVTLSLSHNATGTDAKDWPFSFDAILEYDLRPDGLDIRMRATNGHTGPAPMGIGIHPYFNAAHAPRLHFTAEAVWLNEKSLPAQSVPVPPAWSHTAPRMAGSVALDNCFTGWDGTAHISAGPASLTIKAGDVFRNLQVFTPPGADFFCVEPVSHIPDAINSRDTVAGQQMTILPAGGILEGTILLRFTSNTLG